MPSPPANAAIEMQVENVARLFDPLDPFPLPTRDLSRNAEDFIVGWTRELPRRAAPRIVLHVHDGVADEASVRQAIANHFTARAQGKQRELRNLFRVGRTSLLIGVTVLLACVVTSSMINTALSGPLARFFGEGLIIFGWVANWRPIEIFLYEWWPIQADRRLFERLASAQIEIRADAA